MRKILALSLFGTFLSLAACQSGGEQNGESSQTQDVYIEWHGPGRYYGRYFYVESEYAAWRRQARRGGRRAYRRNQYYHDHHHGGSGGGHHGGGGGGGGHHHH